MKFRNGPATVNLHPLGARILQSWSLFFKNGKAAELGKSGDLPNDIFSFACGPRGRGWGLFSCLLIVIFIFVMALGI